MQYALSKVFRFDTCASCCSFRSYVSQKGVETSLAGMRTFILSGYDYRYPQTCDNTMNSIILLSFRLINGTDDVSANETYAYKHVKHNKHNKHIAYNIYHIQACMPFHPITCRRMRLAGVHSLLCNYCTYKYSL